MTYKEKCPNSFLSFTFTDILGLPKLWVSTCTVLQIQVIFTLAMFQHGHVRASDNCISNLQLFHTGKQNAFPKPVTAHFNNRETLYNTLNFIPHLKN
jgi:hypothetical protein